MFRTITIAVTAFVLLSLGAAPALACGGLVNPNGTVSLTRTTTLAAYVDGVEHYITSFEYAGGGAEFGSIVPLPGIPSKVSRAGDWTLQRLVEEVAPPARTDVEFAAAGTSGDSAKVIMEAEIEALDITVLEGGGDEVGEWALDNGFALTPDAPEILDFYAERSPVFMAARFDPARARERGQQVGDGTPIHLTIPTPDPWVPLRILTLGLPGDATVEADVFLLTQNVPEMLPRPSTAADGGFALARSERASSGLLRDLRSDRGMDWLPSSDMWFSYVKIDAPASRLRHDLALDVTGVGSPSPVAAGLVAPLRDALPEETQTRWAWLAGLVALWGAVAYGRRSASVTK